MSELALQINQVDLQANKDFATSCNGKKQDGESNFDAILKSISQEAVETAEIVEPKESSDIPKICQDEVNELTTTEVDECIQLRPRDMSLDVRYELDDRLFCIADQSTSGANEEIEVVDEVCKLKFSFVPVEMQYEVSEQDQAYSEHADNLDDVGYEGFIDDIGLLKGSEKVEQSLSSINCTFTESGPYNQGKQIAASNLPFVSPKIDTQGVINNDFTNIKLEFSENISNADYQYGYENYYNGTKPITEGRMNFSLDSIETKLVNQVTFSISKAVSSKENNTVVQLEPAELGKIEIIVSNQGKERGIVINSDKISTFELLRKHNDEFLNNVKFGDTENDVTTNLTFNYKDLSGNAQDQREHQALGKKNIVFNSENDNSLTGWGESSMSLIFLPYDVDKNIDVWV